METRALKNEEIVGLILAALGHAALVWVLVNAKPPEPLPPVERVSVTLADELGAVSTSPNPQSDPIADKGPVLGEPAPPPEPQIAAQPDPSPAPKASAVTAPRVPPKPPQQAQKPPTKWPFAPPGKTPQTKTPTRTQGGASVLDPGYEKGLAGNSGKDRTPPASKASAQIVQSWQNSIGVRVKSPWQRCPTSGLDVEKLSVVVTFTLGRDGSLISIDDTRVSGQTPANQAQVRPFRDCAVRAIKLAAPFTFLPPDFYDQWKVRELTFSKGKTR